MSITSTLKARADYSRSDVGDLRRLKEAVYPPSEPWAGESREWAEPQWGVFIREDTGKLVSYTGVVQREGTAAGRAVNIGGLGGVATHPDHRGKGYAPIGMGRALDFLAGRSCDFALLVCPDGLVGYYTRLGWDLLEGDLMVSQFGEPEMFDFNRVMVGGLEHEAPRTGTIDLGGPPW